MKNYVVDLDGTLIFTDLLFESFILLIKKNPIYLFFCVWWLLIGGRAKLKFEISERVEINPENIPYNKELIWYLREVKSEGNGLFLVTASSNKYAVLISNHLKIFDKVQGSTISFNLKGKNKAKWIEENLDGNDYLYVGDSFADFQIWKKNTKAISVGSQKFNNIVGKKFNLIKSFEKPTLKIKTIVKGIRVHQWAKNLLIFLPLLMGHKFSEINIWINAIIAFVAFSLCASSVYLLNDLLDLESDRLHDKKKFRPLASGEMPIQIGLILFPVLLIFSFILSLFVNTNFQVVLLIYYIITLAYSFNFKRIIIWDVITLSLLYTIRIFAGSRAVDIELSQWLLLFSMFFFLSLAFVKRAAELISIYNKNLSLKKVNGRGYTTEDLTILNSLGGGAGFISVLIFALYLNSPNITNLYHEPKTLWFICLFLLYWISRVWILTSRGQMNDDPVVFAIKDKVSYLVGACILITFYYAI